MVQLAPDQGKNIDGHVSKLIRDLEYQVLFLGTVPPDFEVSAPIKALGKLNDQEREVFQFFNHVLQYPECVRLLQKKEPTSWIKDEMGIRQYAVFIAKHEFHESEFLIDGVWMAGCMLDCVAERERENSGVEVLSWKTTFDDLKSGLSIFNECLGLYRTQNIVDQRKRAKILRERFNEIENLAYFDDFRLDRNILQKGAAAALLGNMRYAAHFEQQYTVEHVKQMMINMYQSTGSDDISKVHRGINAVLEFLIGHHLMFRSDNKKRMTFKDAMFTNEAANGAVLPVLSFQMDSMKAMELDGYPSRMGTFRNKDVELCLVTAFSMSVWYRLDDGFRFSPLTGKKFPNFMHKDKWHNIKVLWEESPQSAKHGPVSWDYEQSLIDECFDSINVESLRGDTSINRQKSARIADALDFEDIQIRRAGHWNHDVFDGRYDMGYPVNFMHAFAGFEDDEPYFIPRDIEPSEGLKRKIFPWLDDLTEEVCNNIEEKGKYHGVNERYILGFLSMLFRFRSTILQDLAILMEKAPNCVFCKHPITKDEDFLRFRATVVSASHEAFPSILADEESTLARLAPDFARKLREVQTAIQTLHSLENHNMASLRSMLAEILSEKSKDNVRKFEQVKLLADRVDCRLQDLENTQLELLGEVRELGEQLRKQTDANAQIMAIVSNLDRSAMSRWQQQGTSQGTRQPEGSDVDNELQPSLKKQKKQKKTRNDCDGRLLVSLHQSTAYGLYKEWWCPRPGGIPSVDELERTKGNSYRPDDDTTFKRRKAIIEFVEGEMRTNSNLTTAWSEERIGLQESLREELFRCLDEVRVREEKTNLANLTDLARQRKDYLAGKMVEFYNKRRNA